MDIAEDEFIEILPSLRGAAALASEPLLIRAIMWGHKSQVPTVQVSMSEALYAEIGSPVRFSVAYAAAKKLLRLRGDNDGGRYESVRPGPKSPRFAVRFPAPGGVGPIERSIAPEHYVRADEHVLLIEMPDEMIVPARIGFGPGGPVQVKPAPRAPLPPQAPVIPPSPLAKPETLGVNGRLRAGVGGQKFTPAEATMIDALLRREIVSREQLVEITTPAGADSQRARAENHRRPAHQKCGRSSARSASSCSPSTVWAGASHPARRITCGS